MRTSSRLVSLSALGALRGSQLKAGVNGSNHNESAVATALAGLAIKAQLKAGLAGSNAEGALHALTHSHSGQTTGLIAMTGLQPHGTSLWPDPADDDANIAWTRELSNAMKPFTTGRMYVNFIGDEGEDRVGAAFRPEGYARLQALKDHYDPGNLFCSNQNVKPSGAVASEVPADARAEARTHAQGRGEQGQALPRARIGRATELEDVLDNGAASDRLDRAAGGRDVRPRPGPHAGERRASDHHGGRAEPRPLVRSCSDVAGRRNRGRPRRAAWRAGGVRQPPEGVHGDAAPRRRGRSAAKTTLELGAV